MIYIMVSLVNNKRTVKNEILDKDFTLFRFDVAYIDKDNLKIKRENGDSLKRYIK